MIAAILAAALSGCGGEAISVHGSVEREGNAMAGGRIVFIPAGGGQPAAGDIQSDGTFRTTIERTTDGGGSAAYRVRIIETSVSESGKIYTSYEPPADQTLDVVPGKDNEFTVNIRAQDGWQTHADK